MTNILIINQYGSTPRTGFGGRTYHLAQSLAKSKQVAVVYGSYHHLLRINNHQVSGVDPNSGRPFLIKTVKLLKYSASRSILRIVNWFLFALKLCFLNENAIGFKPSCIIYSSPALPGYLGAFLLSRKFSCPLYLEIRDIWPLSIVELGNYSRSNFLIMFLHQIEKFAYKTADGIISNLFNVKNHVNKFTNKAIRFHYSPNGIVKKSASIGRSCEDSISRDLMLNELRGLRCSGKTIIGYVGGLAAANAMDLLIDCAIVAGEDSDLRWVIVGDGPEKKRLKARCMRLSLQNVLFYPAVSKNEVPLVLEAMDVLFLANQFKELYSFGVSPMKLPEYLESKVPIVHVTNSRSLLEEIDCWETVREFKPSAVLLSIENLLNLSAKQKSEIGELAYQSVRDRLNYDCISDSFTSFIEGKNF